METAGVVGMGPKVPLEPGEVLYRNLSYRAKADGKPYAMAISDQAVFILVRRPGLLQADPWHYKRIPRSEIRRVRLVRARPYGLFLLGGLLIFGGLAAIVFMFSPVMKGEGGVVKAAPFFGVAYGAFIVYSAIGRQAIVIETTGRSITLSPPTSLAAPNKAEISHLHEALIEGCVKAGFVVDRAV